MLWLTSCWSWFKPDASSCWVSRGCCWGCCGAVQLELGCSTAELWGQWLLQCACVTFSCSCSCLDGQVASGIVDLGWGWYVCARQYASSQERQRAMAGPGSQLCKIAADSCIQAPIPLQGEAVLQAGGTWIAKCRAM